MFPLSIKSAFLACAFFCISLESISAHSQYVERNRLISALVQAQQGGKSGNVEKSTAELLLQQARQINQGATPDQWKEVQTEVFQSVSQMASHGGGMVDTLTRLGVADLSNAEIAHLITIIGDPVLAKYTAASSSPAAQEEVMKAAMVDGQHINALINTVLAKEGLREMH